MRVRLIWAGAIAGLVLGTGAVRAQRSAPPSRPDLQGTWNGSTRTPLQRPPKFEHKAAFTPEEAAEYVRGYEDRVRARLPSSADRLTQADVDDTYVETEAMKLDGLRTSLIVDPPDGHFPPMTEEGKRLNAARAEARKRAGAITDAAQNQPLSVRCILMDRDGPPMLAGAYNNNYQIVQSPGTVMILVEMLHSPRIIPLDGRPQLPQQVRQLEGSSRGRWDGDTLVIETTNFKDMFMFAGQGASPDMKLTERFTRVSDDTLMYRFTVDDPKVWTRPWTAEVPWKKAIGPIFEHACHEGNYSLTNLLRGAREDEKRQKGASK